MNDPGRLGLSAAVDPTRLTSQEVLVQTLAEFEQRFKVFSETSVQGKLVLRNYRPLFANKVAARILGFEHPKAIEERLSILGLLDGQTQADPVKAESDAMQGLNEGICQWRRLDGAAITVQIASRPIQWSGASALLIAFNDISELVRAKSDAQAALAKAQTALGVRNRLLSSVSHELRTPLHGAMGKLALAMDEAVSPRCHQLLRGAMCDTRRMLVQIDDILDLAAIENEAPHWSAQPFDLADAVDDALQANAGSKFEARWRLHVDAPTPGQVKVVGDRRRTARIILAILEDGARDTDVDAMTLQVRCSPCGKEIEVRLFTRLCPTQSLDATAIKHTERPIPVLASALTRALGGEIARESGDRPVLTVRLPYPRCANQVDTHAPQPDRSLTVLAVDDHAGNRALIGLILESLGHRAIVVDSGKAALAFMDQAGVGAIDVVLMDLMMPEMDGLTCSRLIRSLPDKRSDIPIVAVTADATDTARQGAEDAGLDAFLTKPLNIATLAETLALLTASPSNQVNEPDTPLVPTDMIEWRCERAAY